MPETLSNQITLNYPIGPEVRHYVSNVVQITITDISSSEDTVCDFTGDGTDGILWRNTSGTTGYWDVSSGSAEWSYVGAPSSAWDVVGYETQSELIF